MVKNLKTISFSGLDSQLEKNRSDINKALKNVLDSCQFIMGKEIEQRGILYGLPITIKDLIDVSGVRCTSGSPIFKNRIAEKSDLLVEKIESEGGIIYAMSNTPEFGAGANTFNEVFGKTLKKWFS